MFFFLPGIQVSKNFRKCLAILCIDDAVNDEYYNEDDDDFFLLHGSST